MTIDQFERAVMSALLAGDASVLDALRQQYAAASASARERSANGFVTRFDVPASAPSIDRDLLHLDDLQVQLAGASAPADCALHVEDGRIARLEVSVYDGTFPESPEIVSAWYYGTERFDGIDDALMAARDLDVLDE